MFDIVLQLRQAFNGEAQQIIEFFYCPSLKTIRNLLRSWGFHGIQKNRLAKR